jgi:predicted ATPase/DNA-binding SARP family transcriptional activator/Flp pilus assembly protein TadD
MPVRLRLFGAPSIVEGDEATPLPLTKPSSLLLHLACRDGWVSRSELAFLYRPDEAEDEALGYLRKLVFRARQFPWATEFDAQDSRLRWSAASDVRAFREAAAARRWAEALACYRGPLLDGLALPDAPGFEAWLELERGAYAAQWKRAALLHADDLQQQGRYDEAGRWLERVLSDDPLDEDTVQRYLQLLRAAGQRHRALEVYEAFQRNLGRELDAEPLEATQALADAIRRGEGMPVPSAPAFEPPARPALPTPTTRFVGRERELGQLASYLARDECRLITLLGLGGSGKTRLALECARRHLDAFADGVFFVPLAGVSAASLLASSIADALGLTLTGSSPPDRQLAQYLHDKDLLLVLDNLEHLLGGMLLIETLLEAAPGLKVLATSRVALELPGEWLFDVGGLDHPPAGTEEALERFDAVKLFIGRAERLSMSFTVTGATLEAIAALCRKVDGMPLALELAASWTRSLGVLELVKRLEGSFELFATQALDVPERHRNLRAVFDYTWRNLGAEEQRVLTRLSLFRGGFTLDAAEAVAQAHLGLLLRFINLALVRRNQAGRFEMHELVRQLLAERLEHAAMQSTRDAFCSFFARFLAERERILKEEDERAALNDLDAEIENLHLAWRWSVEEGRLACVGQMAEGYYQLLDTRSWYQEGAEAFRAAIERLEPLCEAPRERETLGELFARAGYFQFRLGQMEVAKRLLERSLEVPDASASTAGFAHHYLGVLAFLSGDNQEALARYHQALTCHERRNDTWALARTHNNLGVVADTLGAYDEALAWYRQALASSRQAGYLRGVAAALVNVGVTMEALERLDEAEAHYRESLTVYREVGDVRGEAASLTNLGHLAERRGAYPEAKAYYESSVALKRPLGDPVVTAISLTNLGDVQLALGDDEQALEALAEALTLTRRAEARPYALRVIWSYAKFHAQRANWCEALCLASFLAHSPESEVWVRDEATHALEAWGDRLEPACRSEAERRGRTASFERLFAEIASLD